MFWRIIVSLVICTLFRHSKIWIHFLKMMMQVYVNIYLLWCLYIIDLEYVHWYSFNFQRTVMIIVSYHVFFSKVLIIFYALKCKQFSFFSGNLTFLVKNCKIFFSVYAHIYILFWKYLHVLLNLLFKHIFMHIFMYDGFYFFIKINIIYPLFHHIIQ